MLYKPPPALPLTVELVRFDLLLPRLSKPPPRLAVLPLTVQSVRFATPVKLFIPPPATAELPLMVQPVESGGGDRLGVKSTCRPRSGPRSFHWIVQPVSGILGPFKEEPAAALAGLAVVAADDTVNQARRTAAGALS